MALSKKEKVQKYGEVFTPQWMVEKMCDELEKENPGCFSPESTFLEPSCGDGVFILEILRRKFSHSKTRLDYSTALLSVYGMEIQSDNVESCIANVIQLCNEFFKPSKADLETIRDHIILCDSLKVMKLLSQYGERKEMVFLYDRFTKGHEDHAAPLSAS